jgi:hypothetical protein
VRFVRRSAGKVCSIAGSDGREWGRRSATRLAYAVAVFLSAALLFLVEPMVGKMVVPTLGGTPAVWTTCLLFFQVGLLLGYLYAHLLPGRIGLRRQAWVHVGLLALAAATLPVAIRAGDVPRPGQSPVGWLLLALAAAVGAPFVLVAATAPLLQRWFTHLDHPDAADPYFLYAASNLGSFAGLLAYPFAVEPLLALPAQRAGWTAGYLALVAAIALVAILALRQPLKVAPDPPRDPPGGGPERRIAPWRWLLLAAVPSSLLLAVTTHVSTDIAAVPLLWVLPLALYLLSFVATFSRRPWIPAGFAERWLPLVLLGFVSANTWEANGPVWISLPLNYGILFVAGLLCHGELARLRPPARRLTEFYLWVALGGALGGAFNALVAPVVFSSVVEYPIAIAAAAALARWSPWTDGRRGVVTIVLALVAFGIGIGHTVIGLEVSRIVPRGERALFLINVVVFTLGVGAVLWWKRRFGLLLTLGVPFMVAANWLAGRRPDVRLMVRDFFGVYRVQDSQNGGFRALVHGTTIHGLQGTTPELRRRPASYYHPEGPLGDVLLGVIPAHPGRRVGIVGLGAGGTAPYAGPGEIWTYYEIDPLVERIAQDTTYFTYLADARSPPRIVLGDARLSLARDSSARFDVLAIDAFSSDAPPVHLLTREAIRLYLERLAPGGLLLLHVTNRYLEFAPVIAALAADAGLIARMREDQVTVRQGYRGAYSSEWGVLARQEADLGPIARDPRWISPALAAGALWTDDFSNVVRRLR